MSLASVGIEGVFQKVLSLMHCMTAKKFDTWH